MSTARMQGGNEASGYSGVAQFISPDYRIGGRDLRRFVGGRTQSRIVELFRGTLRIGDWRIGQLEVVSTRLLHQNRDQGTGESSTNSSDRPGDTGTQRSAGPSPTPTDTIVVQVTKNESATSIVQRKLINIVRVVTVFVMSSILMLGGIYQIVLKATNNAALTPRENTIIAAALVLSYLGGIITMWLMKIMRIEVSIDV